MNAGDALSLGLLAGGVAAGWLLAQRRRWRTLVAIVAVLALSFAVAATAFARSTGWGGVILFGIAFIVAAPPLVGVLIGTAASALARFSRRRPR